MKTIAEIAAEIGVSKQAIHQKIKQEPLSIDLRQFTSMDGNTLTVDENGEELIKSAFSSLKEKTSVSNVKDKLIETLQSQVDMLSGQNAELLKQLDNEREHSQKQSDKIAEQSNKIIALAENLSRLNENSQLLLAQQKIESLPVPAPEKVSLWNKIFKRRN